MSTPLTEGQKKQTRERVRKWRAANPERKREYDRKWRASPRAKRAARDQYAANPERGRGHSRKWRAANQERVKRVARDKYALKNQKALIVERNRKWRAANPERKRESDRERRVLEKQEISDTRWQQILMVKPTAKRKSKVKQPNMHKFIERFRTLETELANLDYRKSQWCREARAQWAPGEPGDTQFKNWCVVDLGCTADEARGLLSRATVAAIVPDLLNWNKLGGYKALRPLEILNTKDQAAVIGHAKAENKAIRTIMRERGLDRPLLATPITKTKTPLAAPRDKPLEITPGVAKDIAELANFLAQNAQFLPADIRVIVEMYKTTRQRAKGQGIS